GLITTGISPAAVPLLVAATVVYTTFIATVALWFSTATHSTLRATLFTVLATLLIILGPGMLVRMAGAGLSQSLLEPLRWDLMVGDYALTPSATLRTLTFRTADLRAGDRLVPTVQILAAVAGLHLYMVGTGILWLSMRARFQAGKGPAPNRRAPD